MSKDRDMKKWRPFNSVVPSSELLHQNISIEIPTLSKDEIDEFEEKLKYSLSLCNPVEITYIENNKICKIKDIVIGLDPLKKNIQFKNKRINFRQIVNVK